MPGFAAAVDYSPDGRLLAVTGKGGRVTLWDARTLRPAGTLRGLRSTSQALAFSPIAGSSPRPRSAASRTDDHEGSSVRVWDVRRRALARRRFPARSERRTPSPRWRSPPTAGCSPPRRRRTGPRSATRTPAGSSQRLPTEDQTRIGRVLARRQTHRHRPVRRQVLLWSTRDWRPVGRPVEAHEGRVITLSFSGDSPRSRAPARTGPCGCGTWPAEADRISRWSWTDGGPGSPRPSRPTARTCSPSPTGSRRPLGHLAGSMEPPACSVAGRELTAREWQDALPGRPYRSICHAG